MQFLDKVSIKIKAGNGGDGAIAWMRDANTEFGGPGGGNGGKGADVYIEADHNLNTLFHLRFTKHVIAEDGTKGMNKKMYGHKSEDTIVKVPLGTQVFNKKRNELICDLTESGQRYLIAKGGKGGRGNASFLSPINKAPSLYERGDKGEEIEVFLEIKMLADVGLVGMPNAGKSTFISINSKAKPKIANYPFTTVIPVLGIVALDSYRSFLMADLPGLIEGASEGHGLGHDFLKHIERCKCFIHMISMDEIDSEDPYQSYLTIKKELEQYKDALIFEKPFIIVATKMDSENAMERFESFKSKLSKKEQENLYSISSFTNMNVDLVIQKAYSHLEEYNKNVEIHGVPGTLIHREYDYVPEDDNSIKLSVEKISDNSWRIYSSSLSYWAYKIPSTNKDNALRLFQKISSSGAFDLLEKQGIKHLDKYHIDDVEFIYEE